MSAKSEVQRQRDALSALPYSEKDCDGNSGHLLTSRSTGAPVIGGPSCLRCGVEVTGAATRITAGNTITDPLSRLSGRKA